jgi:hypothetical protein
MDVEAAEPRRVEDRARQDQAVGRDHGGIEAECGEGGLLLLRLQRDRMAHRQAQGLGPRLDRRGLGLVAASGRARRLAVDGGDLVPGRRERVQHRHGEIRRAHEGEAQALAGGGH